MTTKVRPPARMPALRPNIWMKKSMPTRPKMTEGMPVRVSTAKLMSFTTRLLTAYSLR